MVTARKKRVTSDMKRFLKEAYPQKEAEAKAFKAARKAPKKKARRK